MTRGGRALTALHLLLVWAAMALAIPALGFGLLMAAWGSGAAAAAPVLLLGVALTMGLLVAVGVSARPVVPMCSSPPRRLGWAAVVFVLGTLGVLAGLAAYGGDVDMGTATTRVALTGLPYAVAAAFFVPSGWVRLGAVAALMAGVLYAGIVGPAYAQQRRHEAEIAMYQERAELLYLATTPPGMRLHHAYLGPADFTVEYRPLQHTEPGYAHLTIRSSPTPVLRCPEVPRENETCTVDAAGDLRLVRDLAEGPGITLVRRHGNAEVEVFSQALDEAGLRTLLSTLRPLSETELEDLLRERRIDNGR
ncbi:hypothetical protein ACFVUW_26010 [Streptomyces xiamenensis]|uniref:hypothetical protein n=1 Tax=Streptomyces xiamenensis TaxID=408015 RepID=UPI0036ED0782